MKGKKLLSVIMSIMLVSLSGCGNKAENVENDNIVSSDNTTSVSSQQVDEEKDTTTSQTGNDNIDNNTSKIDENTTSEPITSTVIQTMVQNIVSSVKQLDEPTTSQEPVVNEPTVSENPVIIEPTTSEPAKPIDEPDIIFATQILLNKTSISLTVGDTTIITATLLPTNVTDKVIKWTSSNTSVATVSNGKITAKAIGTATITATTSNGKTAICTVTVKEKETTQATNISIYKNYYSYHTDGYVRLDTDKRKVSECEINLGNDETLMAIVSPSSTNQKVTWSSSNTSVATIDSNGKVTTKKQGVTIITATASSGIKTTCKLTVTERHPYDRYDTMVNGCYYDVNAIKQDAINYIKSLGINYVEMGLNDGSWSIPIIFYNFTLERTEFNEIYCERMRYDLYRHIDGELATAKIWYPDIEPYEINMCPVIWEDPDHKGEIYVTMVYN